MNKTEHYQLNQWEKADRIQMEDFNEDNAKIEAAFAAQEAALAQEAAARAAADTNLQSSMAAAIAAAGNCKIMTGSYVGTGTTGTDNPMSLSFDFYPLIVFLDIATASSYNGIPEHYILFRPATKGIAKESGTLVVSWQDNGVSWYFAQNSGAGKYLFNIADQTYHYLAIGV